MSRVKGNHNVVHLRTFLAVMNAGSHVAAAKELGYTTSAVSQQIAALEKGLGVALFERGARALWPTPAGKSMAVHAGDILAQLVRAQDAMEQFKLGVRGSLRVAASGTVAAQLVPKAVASLLSRLPNTELDVQDIVSAEVPVALLSGIADLGLVYEYAGQPIERIEGLIYHELLEEELVILGGGANREDDERIELASCATEVWATGQDGSDAAISFKVLCSEAGFNPDIRFHSNDFDVVRGLVREALAMALVPALALGIDRGIRMRRLSAPAPRRRIFAVHRSADPNPTTVQMLGCLSTAADGFLQWTRTAFLTRLESPLVIIQGMDQN